MSYFKCAIDPGVFTTHPEYVRGVVIAEGVKNGPTPPTLTQLLRMAEDSVHDGLDAEQVAAHPRIASWREAFRSFGAKPSEYRSSVEAMVRRVLRGGELPSITSLVDIGNVVSLRNLVPAGGHSIDDIQTDMVLRPATGQERFTPFGSEEEESPEPGEIIFAEGDIVLTRRWTWRQATHTALGEGTRSLEVNIDGLPPVTASEIEKACRETMELIEEFCGGTSHHALLTREHPQTDLAV